MSRCLFCEYVCLYAGVMAKSGPESVLGMELTPPRDSSNTSKGSACDCSDHTRDKEKHPAPSPPPLRSKLDGKGTRMNSLSYAFARCRLPLYPRSSPVSYGVEFTEEIKGHGVVEKTTQKWPVVRRV